MNSVKRTKSSKKTPVKHKKIFKRTHNPVVLKKLSIALVITCLAVFAYVKVYPYTYDAKQAQKLQDTIQQVQKLQQQTKQIKADSAQQQSDKDKKLEELNKQLQQAQEQLQAKAASKSTVYAAAAPVPTAGGSSDCGSDPYLAQIYQHESGCCPTKWQGQTYCPTGYAHIYDGDESDGWRGYGLCQSTPAIKMAVSGDDWRTSWSTQNAWCTSYAIARYGSTSAAWAHWQNYGNW